MFPMVRQPLQNVSQNIRLEMTFVKDTAGKWGLRPSLEALGCDWIFASLRGNSSLEFLQALGPLIG